MSQIQRFIEITSRIERVVMMTMITILLKAMENIIPIHQVAIIYGSINIICMTLLHTVKTHTPTRILHCIRRITLFVFTHAVMRSSIDASVGNVTDSGEKIILFLKGFAVLCTLTLIPKTVTDEDDGGSFGSQITYAYATSVGGFLDPLQTSRLFTLTSFMFIVLSPNVHSQLNQCAGVHLQIISNCLQAFDLVVFDAFTSQAFIDSGDSFCDLSIILGCFNILWNFHNISPSMEGIQQFTTWRTAAFISKAMNALNVNSITLSVLMIILIMIHSAFSGLNNIGGGIPWLPDLLFLVALNGVVQYVQMYVDTIGSVDGLPVMLGLVLTATIVHDSVNQAVRNTERVGSAMLDKRHI